jgi:negative elongation factor C/D
LELKKKFIDIMIELMKTGYALPVMNFIEQMAPKTDQSLIRYFIIQLMDIIEPPYSQEFLNSLLGLIERPETIEAFRSTDKKELLYMWVEHCLETEYEWDDHQKVSLQKLYSTFS